MGQTAIISFSCDDSIDIRSLHLHFSQIRLLSESKQIRRIITEYNTFLSMLQHSPFKPGQAPQDSRRLRLPEFLASRHMKEARLSALRTDRLYPKGDTPSTHISHRLSAAGRIKSMKNPKDSIGNRTRDLPDCTAVPQSTAPPRTVHVNPTKLKLSSNTMRNYCITYIEYCG